MSGATLACRQCPPSVTFSSTPRHPRGSLSIFLLFSAYSPRAMTVEEILLDEKLDAIDPLRHLRNDDDPDGEKLVPAQAPSILNQTTTLSFPSIGENIPNPISIQLFVDASPGCGGIAWPAGEVKLDDVCSIISRLMHPIGVSGTIGLYS